MKKNKNMMFYGIGAVLLYFLSTGISYAGFSLMKSGSGAKNGSPVASSSTTKTHYVVDPSLPKTEVCPLNGQMFTKQEKDIWEKRRPLAVMIENHPDSRPQSGLSYADIVYEAVAEGAITRFMGVFYCGAAAYDVRVAPVRSARTYYLDWLLEYDALYNHVGGAGNCNDDTVDPRAKALCQIEQYGVKDLSQFSLPFKVCRRNESRTDRTVDTEHTVECYTNELYDFAKEKRNWTNVDEEGVAWDENFQSWKFKDDAKAADFGTVNKVSFVHWEGYEKQFGVEWNFDAPSDSYKRVMAGEAHIDQETKQQLAAKNVVIQFEKETVGVDEHQHLLYGTLGEGKALIFQDGKAIEATWKKPKRVSRTKYFDNKGKEISLNRGPVWIEVVATGVKVTY